jgi:hypothetical protein
MTQCGGALAHRESYFAPLAEILHSGLENLMLNAIVELSIPIHARGQMRFEIVNSSNVLPGSVSSAKATSF